MMDGNKKSPCRARTGGRPAAPGFTLIELLVVTAIVALLASFLLPALSRVKSRALSVQCLSNQRQLTMACLLYAAEHEDELPYNMGTDEIRRSVAQDRYYNWCSSVLDWELTPDNTNTDLLIEGGIGADLTPGVYRCPSDLAVSDLQLNAGWQSRVRSFSMNAMVGNAGEYSRQGTNINNPNYRQFFKLGEIIQPARIFVFIEEHPDSINDGYFLNKPPSMEWTDLPASYHNGAANLSYADGHSEAYRWRFAATKPPPRPDAVELPFVVPLAERADFGWLMSRTSLEAGYRY